MKLRPALFSSLSRYQASADLLAEFAADNRLGAPERRRLREYFALRRDGLRAAHYNQLLGWLSPNMRARLKFDRYGEMLSRVSVFCSADARERRAFVGALAVRLEGEAYPAHELVYAVGDAAGRVHFVLSGLVALRRRGALQTRRALDHHGLEARCSPPPLRRARGGRG